MTVKELIKILSKFDEDMEVYKRFDDVEHGISEAYADIYEVYIGNHEVILD